MNARLRATCAPPLTPFLSITLLLPAALLLSPDVGLAQSIPGGPGGTSHLANPQPPATLNSWQFNRGHDLQPQPPATPALAPWNGSLLRGYGHLSLNPQPEPPGVRSWTGAFALTGHPLQRGSAVGLNPQPEPPSRGFHAGMMYSGHGWVGLNPQPEPPSSGFDGTLIIRPGEWSGLNPQPEPPRSITSTATPTDLRRPPGWVRR